jgi:hypothetical protein
MAETRRKFDQDFKEGAVRLLMQHFAEARPSPGGIVDPLTIAAGFPASRRCSLPDGYRETCELPGSPLDALTSACDVPRWNVPGRRS